MDEPAPRGLTLEQAHNERRDCAINQLQQQMERVLNLLENQARQEAPPRGPPINRPRHKNPHPSSGDESNNTGSDSSDSDYQARRRRGRHKDNDRDVKVEVPEFEGSLNPDDFIDWLHAVERVFEFKSYSDEKKCKVAVLKFKKYASLWWENQKNQRIREGKSRVKSWEKLKKLMKKRFLPVNYKQDLFLKLNSLKQHGNTVEEYIREFEQLLMRCDIPEAQKQTIARFLGGLNQEVQDLVEFQPYWTFEDICKLAIKVEKQLKGGRRFSAKPSTRGTSFFKGSSSSKVESTSKQEKGKEKSAEFGKDLPKKLESGGRKCFKCHGYGHLQADCPNRRVMTLQEIEKINFELQDAEEAQIDFGSEKEDEVVAQADEGEFLVIRRALHTMIAANEEEQRENIFQTRCTINGKVCTLIIDSRSCTNVASTVMVEKLKLATSKHPQPYKLQWLNKGSDLQVTKQAIVSFSIGKSY
ncbi:hypothetical protein BT93_G1786 [Corymbia citriodora subsp. variegata]|nr:hypothetical protein BT93_G1786 [Corymbia citriodora subsp. variegata]